jgi:hypothetical protein
VFRLGSGAICQLEESLNLDVMELFEQLQKGKVRLGTIREFVKASAVDPKDMDNEQANDCIDDCGVMPLLNAMTDSILATFNIKTDDKDKKNPQKPVPVEQAGSGSSSARQKRAS